MRELRYRQIKCTRCNKTRLSTAFEEKNLETEFTCYQCQDSHYRDADGHTYIFSFAENEWIGFPTFIDGEPDWLNPTAVSDFNITEQAEKELSVWLKERKGIQNDYQ